MFRNILRKIFPKNKPMMLGRWGNNLNDTQKSINSVWTNSDHCGDIICGKPENVKNIINDINDNIKKSNKINEKNIK